jgi:hypothetical protein
MGSRIVNEGIAEALRLQDSMHYTYIVQQLHNPQACLCPGQHQQGKHKKTKKTWEKTKSYHSNASAAEIIEGKRAQARQSCCSMASLPLAMVMHARAAFGGVFLAIHCTWTGAKGSLKVHR